MKEEFVKEEEGVESLDFRVYLGVRGGGRGAEFAVEGSTLWWMLKRVTTAMIASM